MSLVNVSKVGEEIGPTSIGRTCVDCQVWKARNEYYIVKSSGNLFAYCKECSRTRNRSKYSGHRENKEQMARYAAANHRSKQQVKQDVLAAYGGHCVCCGEDEPRFLTLDHVNNDGAQHRRETGLATGSRTWAYARREGYPDIFQLLCWNCNSAKGAYGTCPHQESLLLTY